MKKYLISIEKEDSARLTNFFSQATFRSYQNKFKKIGVIGRQIPTAEYFKLAVAGRKKALSPSELGCTLSHVNAFKDFLASDEKYACIFEDDAICVNDLDLDQLELQIVELDLQSCFFLSMGGIQLKNSDKVRGTFLEKKISDMPVLKLHPMYFGRLFYTYAYVVDRKMAEVLLRYHETPKVCDHWSHIRDYDPTCQFYATFLFNHPELDETTTGKSYIEQERNLSNKEEIIKNSIFHKWKISILKRFFKITLSQYPK